MPQAWYLDESCVNYGEENCFDPTRFVSLDKLKKSTGIECYKVDVEDLQNDKTYWQVRKDKGYYSDDVVEVSKQNMRKEEYEEKVRVFYTEHLHSEESGRLYIGGGGYLDVRDQDNKWIRIHVYKNDFIIIPAGAYHRFTLDKEKYLLQQRLFKTDPVWEAKFRPEGDEETVRKQYVKHFMMNTI